MKIAVFVIIATAGVAFAAFYVWLTIWIIKNRQKFWVVRAVGLAVFFLLLAVIFHIFRPRPDFVIESAVRHRNVEGVKKYIAAGYDVRIHIRPGDPDGGFTALQCACGMGYPEIAKILIDAGAEVDATDDRGWTPLMQTVVADTAPGQPECARLLIAAGADVGKQGTASAHK